MSFTSRPLVFATLLTTLVSGASCNEEAEEPTNADPISACDAGDEAWVKQAIQLLLGRKPESMQEVRVLVDLVHATSRSNVAAVLMTNDEFEQRMAEWLMDEVYVNTVGQKIQRFCFGDPLLPGVTDDLARFVRDNPPSTASYEVDFNMTDLLRSSLRLDSLAPFYLAVPFPTLARPSIYCNNVDPEGNDLARRKNFGDILSAVYLNRNLECLSCHNSEASTTYSADPAVNRFWAVQGAFEKAIFEYSAGRPQEEAFGVFRYPGVVASNFDPVDPRPAEIGVQPWGLAAECGEFLAPDQVEPDTTGVQSFFVQPLGDTPSIWNFENSLRQGFAALEGVELTDMDAVVLAGPASLAYLLAQRISQQAWVLAFGSPLTVAHGFPRNQAQRDILVRLTARLVSSHWSLRELFTEILLDEHFNRLAPDGASACGDQPYDLAAIFNPWSPGEDDPAMRSNGVGDLLHRETPRALLHSVTHAFQWQETPRFPSEVEAGFQASIGVFLSDNRSGFLSSNLQQMLAWENRFGAAVQPSILPEGPLEVELTDLSCKGRCNFNTFINPSACSCDLACELFGDCCEDFAEFCKNDVEANPPPDWIDLLAATAAAWDEEHPDQPVLVRDIAVAVKDRLITETAVSDDEEAQVIAALYGVSSIDTPISEVPDWLKRTRMYAGVLLKTPQFLLRNLAPLDQTELGRLTVGATSYRELCNQWSGPTQRALGKTLRCNDDSLDL